MKKFKKSFISISSFILSLLTIIPFAVSCSTNTIPTTTNPNKPSFNPTNPSVPDEKPKPLDHPFAPDPNETIDQDNQQRTINNEYVKNIIKTNEFGYSPNSYKNQLIKWWKQKDDSFLNNLFSNKQVSNWSSLQNFVINADDKIGELKISFKYGSINYSYTLTRNDGLMSDGNYNKRIDDLTFNFSFSSVGIVSNRGKFPILNPDTNQLVEEDKSNNYKIQASYENNGLKLGGRIDDYVIKQTLGGTGWLVDYLPSVSNTTQDFYEFIVATNIHVSNLSNFFVIPFQSGFYDNPKSRVALDPLYVKSQWFRHKGTIDYNQPNQFTENYLSNENTGNIIPNLSFNLSNWNNGNGFVRDLFFKNVIRNMNRKGKSDETTFSTWNHPLSDAKQQKETLMKDLNFYKAVYQSNFQYDDVINPYWINQIGEKKETQYYNIASDFNFAKVKFKKSDLQAQWPNLYQALTNNTIKDFLLPINQKPIDTNQNNIYYASGYPYYSDATDVFQKNNGYKKEYEIGSYYQNVKLFPQFANQWPNLTSFGFEKGSLASESGLNWWQYGPLDPSIDNPKPDDYFRPYYSTNKIKHWNSWDPNKVEDTMKKTIYFNTQSKVINDWNTIDITKAYKPYEYQASSSNRGMVQTYYSNAKKHMWGSSQYVIGGYSGSMVISPKLEIMGLISSYEENTAIKGQRNVIFEDFVNTSSAIISGEKIILHGLLKEMKKLNVSSTLYKELISTL